MVPVVAMLVSLVTINSSVIVFHVGKRVKSKQSSNIIAHKGISHEYEVLNMTTVSACLS